MSVEAKASGFRFKSPEFSLEPYKVRFGWRREKDEKPAAGDEDDKTNEEPTPKPEPVLPTWALDMYKKTKEALALEQAGQKPEDEGVVQTKRETGTEDGDPTEPDPNHVVQMKPSAKMKETG